MAAPKPERGLVIRYDFLFASDQATGLETGKDRPCAIVLTSKPQGDGAQWVIVCPITHSPPDGPQDAVEIPHRVCRHLGLDDDRMWIKVNELNRFTWAENRVPFGMTPAAKGRWAYGFLPPSLYKKVRDGVARHAQGHGLTTVDRDDS